MDPYLNEEDLLEMLRDFSERMGIKFETLLEIFNKHTHCTPGGPSAPPPPLVKTRD